MRIKRFRFLLLFVPFMFLIAVMAYTGIVTAGTPSSFYCGYITHDITANILWKQVGSANIYIGNTGGFADDNNCIGIWDTTQNIWLYSIMCHYADERRTDCYSSNLGGQDWPYAYPPCPIGSQDSGDGCTSGCSSPRYLDNGYCTPSGTPAIYAQGDTLTVSWSFTCSGSGNYFVDGDISVTDSSGTVILDNYVTTRTGSQSLTLSSSAPIGVYTITSWGECSKDNSASGGGNVRGNPYFLVVPVVSVPQTCTSFTYSGWTACVNGQRTRTVTSSSPAGCTGGNPVTTQSCLGNPGDSCTDTSQCASGLVCQGGVCFNPPHQCTGSIPSNAGLCTGDDTGLTADTPRTLVSSCGVPKCEYTCSSGYAYSGGTCVPTVYSCTGAVPSNANICTGDDTGLTADTPRTLVSSCGAPKCEYTCSSGYAYSGGTCVPITYSCTGSIPSNSQLCSGDDSGLSADTARTLVSACGAPKCEYYCNSGYAYQSGACVAIPGAQCTGAVPPNSQLCTGDASGLTVDTPITLVSTCGAPKCEYTCSSGYVYDSGVCRQFQCTGSIPSNAGLCTGDDSGLSADTARTLVSACGAPKCEYYCNSGYMYQGGVCVDIPTPQCTGSIPSNAGLCTGDASGLTVDTPITLVSTCGAPKCEYTCVSGYTYQGGVCRLDQCTGSIPSNSQLCSGDDSSLTVDTPITLVSTCGLPKCEYYCDSGYNYWGGACVAIPGAQCTGAVPPNSQLCSGDASGLTVDTPITLVSTCGAPKCEYTCVSGYTYQGGVCRLDQCTGSIPSNSQLCSGDDSGLSADTARTLVSACGAPKCEYYCNSGYMYQGGVCVDIPTPQCTGSIPSNAGLCTGDASGLTVDTPITLVSTCGAPKCEYTCVSGYTYQGGVCRPFQCMGSTLANSQLCSGDDTGLTADTPITLVSTCGLPKCEYYCNSGYAYQGGACVAIPGAQCTGAVPPNSQLCSGDASGLTVDTPITLVSTCGAPKCEYTCVSGYTYQGGVCRPFQCTGSIPNNADLCSGDDTGLTADTARKLVSACGAPKCEYTCSSGYAYQGGVCVSSTEPKLTDAQWQNMLSAQITSANDGDRVRLAATGSNLAGQTITFDWYKSVPLWIDTHLGSTTVTAGVDDYVSYDLILDVAGGGNIYFKANVASSTITSGMLALSSTYVNKAPVAVISTPVEKSAHFGNIEIDFNETSYDEDSKIAGYKWDFGDGSTSTAENTTHSFSSTGIKKITLTVTDEQGATASAQVSILIVGIGSNVYSFIENPESGSSIVTSCLYGNDANCLKVDYSGMQSYAIDITSSAGVITSVTCVAGACPSEIDANPPLLVANPLQGYNNLFFNWTFNKDRLLPNTGYATTNSNAQFASPGDKNISLELKYVSQNSLFSRDFKLFDQRQCSTDGNIWYNISANKVIGTRDTRDPGVCTGVDGLAGTGDDCCPQGFVCAGSSATATCQVDELSGCSSYTTEPSCNNDSSNRVKTDILWEDSKCQTVTATGTLIHCRCQWVTNLCEFTVNDCSYTTETSACENGFAQVTINTESTDLSCTPSGTIKSLQCGRPVIELPFFTLSQSLFAVAVIILIYIMLRRLQKKDRRHRHVFK